jgi:hypothetical protein
MYDWAVETASKHRHMRLVEEIFVPDLNSTRGSSLSLPPGRTTTSVR